MDSILQFLEYQLINSSFFQLSVKQVLYSLLLLIVGFVAFTWFKRIVSRNKYLKKIEGNSIKKLLRLSQIIGFIIILKIIVDILNINLHNIFDYKIVSTGKISITLYNIVVLIIIIIATRLVLYIIEAIFNSKMSSNELDKGKNKSVFQIVKYLTWVLAITFFFESLGFSITFIIASLSALLVGLGLGIQNFFNDLVSGIVILFDRSIKVGDVVEVQGEIIGKVQEIRLRTSTVISRENVAIILPNSKFTSENIINWSHNSRKTRFGVTVGVAYGSNVSLVEKLLIDACIEHEKIDDNPKPKVFFRDFGESSLDFEVMFYSEDNFRVEMVKSDLRFAINKKFAENNITIPFPQRDVNFLNKS